jgi:hypothetical protein
LTPPFFTTLESAAEKGGKSGISLDAFAPLFLKVELVEQYIRFRRFKQRM